MKLNEADIMDIKEKVKIIFVVLFFWGFSFASADSIHMTPEEMREEVSFIDSEFRVVGHMNEICGEVYPKYIEINNTALSKSLNDHEEFISKLEMYLELALKGLVNNDNDKYLRFRAQYEAQFIELKPILRVQIVNDESICQNYSTGVLDLVEKSSKRFFKLRQEILNHAKH